eukprot:617377-Pleurochrysis_carterae.AAC.2
MDGRAYTAPAARRGASAWPCASVRAAAAAAGSNCSSRSAAALPSMPRGLAIGAHDDIFLPRFSN